MEDRQNWRQNIEEQTQTSRVIAQLEDAIKRSPKTAPEYIGEDRRKTARLSRRETLARVLVNLNTALARLEATGSLDDSARVWLIEGLDASCVLTMDAYFDAKGKVTIPEHRIEKLRVATGDSKPVQKETHPSPVLEPEDFEL